MSFWYHQVEAQQIGALMEYEKAHPDSTYEITFSDGERYIAQYSNLDSGADNSNDLDIDVDDPHYDEFYQLDFKLSDTSPRGRRNYNDYLCVDYRDFPSRIKDAVNGKIIYPQ